MSVLDYINSDIFTPVYQNKLPVVKTLNIERICRELFFAIKSNEKIFVYGDYDMDGFCAVKVWDEVLSSLYDQPIIPFQYVNRTHSIDTDIIRQAKESGARIVIICDTGSGSKDHETVSMLILNGHLPIVIDHHNWEGDYKAVYKYHLVYNAFEERELLGGYEISGAYASLLVCNHLCGKYFNTTLPFNAMVYALASMYSDVVDLSTPPGRALYNVVSTIKMPGPALMTSLNKWGYAFCKRLFSFIIAPKINACFRTETFNPLNRALHATDKYVIGSVVESISEVHSEASQRTKMMVPLFERERYGNILLCIHAITDETRLLHIRNFSGVIATRIASEEKCMVLVVIKDGNCYEGSYRDFYSRKMLNTFKLFCEANGHDAAFGVKFNDVNDIRRHLRMLSSLVDTEINRDYTVLSSSLVTTKEDIQALSLYNEYMNVNSVIMLSHRCSRVRLVRNTRYRKFYDIDLPYNVSSSLPLLEGSSVLIEPTISKSVELRCVE